MLIALLYTATILPYQLCFVEDGIGWVIVELTIDAVFVCDLVLNFFVAYKLVNLNIPLFLLEIRVLAKWSPILKK
jgi:hypothetical protein